LRLVGGNDEKNGALVAVKYPANATFCTESMTSATSVSVDGGAIVVPDYDRLEVLPRERV